MNKWIKQIFVLLIALGIYYLAAYFVVSVSVTNAINTYNAENPGANVSAGPEIAAAFAALFPVPIVLTGIGILLSKWIPF